jgi:hypothetical protein
VGVQNLFWAVGSPKFILDSWESKIYFGQLGVQNLFWAVGSPKFILGSWESKIYFGQLGVQNLFWMTPTHALLITPAKRNERSPYPIGDGIIEVKIFIK